MAFIPKSLSDVGSHLTELYRRVRNLESANPLQAASIGQGGIRTENFDGTSFSDPGTTGNYFGADGLAVNEIYLRGGIVGNDALTSPVFPKSVHADANPFSLSTTQTAKATATVTVPAGFSQALVMVVGQVTARNTTSAQDFLAVGVMIDGVQAPGWAAEMDAVATASVHPSVSATACGTSLLTSLGGSFTIQVRASTGAAAWSSDPFNSANVDAIVLFLR